MHHSPAAVHRRGLAILLNHEVLSLLLRRVYLFTKFFVEVMSERFSRFDDPNIITCQNSLMTGTKYLIFNNFAHQKFDFLVS